MIWSTVLIAMLLLIEIRIVKSNKNFVIYWNVTNPIFRIDRTDNVIDVNEGNADYEYDQLNIICPLYSHDKLNNVEKYIIYNVSKEEYDSCIITHENPKIIAFCDQPHKLLYFTVTFREFSPQPTAMEFKPGHNYYFISTSKPGDIYFRNGGGCLTHNMKVMFKVAKNRNNILNNNVQSPQLHLRPSWSTNVIDIMSNEPIMTTSRYNRKSKFPIFATTRANYANHYPATLTPVTPPIYHSKNADNEFANDDNDNDNDNFINSQLSSIHSSNLNNRDNSPNSKSQSLTNHFVLIIVYTSISLFFFFSPYFR